MPTWLKWDKSKLADLKSNLRKLGGTAKSIRGVLTENQHYAIYNEFGTVRMAARPHMRPALSDVMRTFVPKVCEWMQRTKLTDGDFDAKLADAVTAAMYEMDARRRYWLEVRIYSTPESPSYQRTGNLRENASIHTFIDGRQVH